jgi:hypothetical protein
VVAQNTPQQDIAAGQQVPASQPGPGGDHVSGDQPVVSLLAGPHRQASTSPTAAGNARYSGAVKPAAGAQGATAQSAPLQQQVPHQLSQQISQQTSQQQLTPGLSGPGGVSHLTPQELLPRVSGPGLPGELQRGPQRDGGGMPHLGDSGLLPALGDSGLPLFGDSGVLPEVPPAARHLPAPPAGTGRIHLVDQVVVPTQSPSVTHIHSSHAPVTPVQPAAESAAAGQPPAVIPGLSPASAASAAEMVGGAVKDAVWGVLVGSWKRDCLSGRALSRVTAFLISLLPNTVRNMPESHCYRSNQDLWCAYGALRSNCPCAHL